MPLLSFSHAPPPSTFVSCAQIVQDHGWTEDDRIVAVTLAGRIIVIDECEVRQEFFSPKAVAGVPSGGGTLSAPSTPSGRHAPRITAATESYVKRLALHCVAVHQSGFITGGDAGTLVVFDKEASNFTGDGTSFLLLQRARAQWTPDCVALVTLCLRIRSSTPSQA